MSTLSSLLGCARMERIFSDAIHVQRMLDFEAALAHAQGETGVIPADAAASIVGACDEGSLDLEMLAQDAAKAGNLAIPLVTWLTARVARDSESAARYVHWGATSQDVLDTALVLQIREALAALGEDARSLEAALAKTAGMHRRTVLAGRTWLQHAAPTTLGLKAAVWLDGFHRAFLRLEHAARAASVLQLGGAVGTLAALGPRGPRVAGAMAAALKLSLPDIPWHASRDRVVDVGAALGLVCGALGKLARDVSLMAQTEVAEVSEGNPPGEGGSSTLPHKQNPVSCAVALQAAHRAPGLVATLLSAMPQEHERGLGGWQAEWETLPELFRITAGSLQRMARLLETLQVDASRMRADLDATGGLALAEAVSMALARTLGKAQAHAHVERASRKAVDDGAAFVSVLRADADIVNALGAELDALLEPESYLGSSDAFIDAVLARRETDERRRSV